MQYIDLEDRQQIYNLCAQYLLGFLKVMYQYKFLSFYFQPFQKTFLHKIYHLFLYQNKHLMDQHSL
ncbi:hypothetical protein D3C76_1058840 [compost metagenome]